MSKIIAISNQKGGTAKSTTAINMGAALARRGFKVLLIDLDSQGSMSIGLGIEQPDLLDITICTAFDAVIEDKVIDWQSLVYSHGEGIDFIPSNIDLAAMDVSLVNVMSRERILKEVISHYQDIYDYILIDCMPSLGMLTINAFAAADSVLIPVQAGFLPAKGLEQLIRSVGKVKKQLNAKLYIEGVLITMFDSRTNFAKDIIRMIQYSYGDHIRIFETMIPYSIRAAEASASGGSIFLHAPRSKVAKHYNALCEEVLCHE